MDTHQATLCIDHGQKGNRDGYGHTQGTLLHRAVFVRSRGEGITSIAGKVVRHSCDNPRCINPDHLLLGTQADNMRDKSERGRAAQPKRRHLTDAEVQEIRRDYIPGGSAPGTHSPTGQRALARKYGVSQATIRQVVNFISYKETQ